jgi:hypothetical protein
MVVTLSQKSPCLRTNQACLDMAAGCSNMAGHRPPCALGHAHIHDWGVECLGSSWSRSKWKPLACQLRGRQSRSKWEPLESELSGRP